MRVGSRARIGAAFIALGVVLILAVGLLMHSALARLQAQRDLRHRMVAERIFDEAERELSSLLAHEAERPSAAYEAQHTRIERWAPFVVGYLRLQPSLVIVAEGQLEPQRRARITQAVAAVRGRQRLGNTGGAHRVLPAAEPLAAASRISSPHVLSKLNRGAWVRARAQGQDQSGFEVLQANATTLVMLRASEDGSRREGLVLDMPAMVALIQAWLISSQGLDDVATLRGAATDAPSEAPAMADGGYLFEHALAPPFDSQRLTLSLAALDDADARTTLFGLTGLLVGAALLGLGSLYRMVAVQMSFTERRDNFVAAVSHELRTPLTAIRMYAEMLREGMVDDEATRQEYYDILTAEGERLTRLVNNVMEHAQLRQGQRPMQIVGADAGAIVREVLDVMAPHIAHEGFSTELVVAPDLPRTRFDADALKQVLFNVIDNALKYGKGEGPRRLEVHCERDGGEAVLRLRDYGPGLPAQHLAHIFEPFYRGQSELTREQTGTGLGMALARDLVVRMDGDIRATTRAPGLEVSVRLRAAPGPG